MSALRRALGITVLALLAPLAGCDQRTEQGTAPLMVFGRTGMGVGEFSYPRAAVADSDGLIYIVDKTARIQCYRADGEIVRFWRTPARDAGKPTGLGVGRDGSVYVADTHYSRVLVYDSQGTLVDQFGSFGQEPGQFGLPTDVAVGPDDCIYVSEYGLTDRVSKFSAGHEFLLSFGGPDAGSASLRRPQGLLIDADGTVWVADACNHRICHFDANGRSLGAFGRSGSAPGELRFPYSIDLLSDGTFVVAEYGNARVQRFDRGGQSLGIWGTAGRAPGQLAYPWAAVVLPGDRVAVLDSGNNRVQIIAGAGRDTWRSGQP